MVGTVIYRLIIFLLLMVVNTSYSQILRQNAFIFFVAFLIGKTIMAWKYISSLPPGPRGLPLLGYLPFIKRALHEELAFLSRKYGPVFSVRLGSELIVVLRDHRIIRETFRKEEYTARPDNPIVKIIDGCGLISADVKLRKDQRKFLQRHFGVKHMGPGRDMMEARIMAEVESLLVNLAKENSAPVNFSKYTSSSVFNVISTALRSDRLSHDDRRFIHLMTLMDNAFRLFIAVPVAMFILILRFLLGITQAYNKIAENHEEICNFYRKVIKSHRKAFRPYNPCDIIVCCLTEIEKATADARRKLLFNETDADRRMQHIIGDLFSAGNETVNTILQWASMFAVRHPEVQKNIQDELDRVVGRNRLPSLSDLPNLTYTQAFIYEVMRKATVVPMGSCHATSSTTTLNGHIIPKGTQVVPLIHAIHMDPALWNHPEQFLPGRFLTSEGKIQKPDFFMPFGVGKRVCLGQVLARSEIFLFFSSVLHTFTLEVPEGADTFTPESFCVSAVPRTVEL